MGISVLAVYETAELCRDGYALEIVDRLSPRNSHRPRRPDTKYIVLHTTEGGDEGSLQKLVKFGEAHYFIARSGKVTRIIDESKIARHSGRSMWEGISNIDNHSIGIEVSGYHNRDITNAQYEALKELLRRLKSRYNISDNNVVTHSMVAYGTPNRFHDENHRGRKRCAMIFANPKIRARIGLNSAPARDVDVEAGRLTIGDKELFAYLFAGNRRTETALADTRPINLEPDFEEFETPLESDPSSIEADMRESILPSTAADMPESAAIPSVKSKPAITFPIETLDESPLISPTRTAWQIARERYNAASTLYIFPDGKRINGNQIKDWGGIPSGTRVVLSETTDDPQPFDAFLEIGKDGDTARAIAGKAVAAKTTIYFFPDGLIITGAELQKNIKYRARFKNPPKGTRLLLGYIYGGRVKKSRRPSSIAGVKWNYPSTYYRYPNGRIISGDDIRDKNVPVGTLVFFQE